MEQLEVLLKNYPVVILVLSGLGTLVVAATAFVAATPSKSDDLKLEAIKKKPFIGPMIIFFERFSTVSRKDPSK